MLAACPYRLIAPQASPRRRECWLNRVGYCAGLRRFHGDRDVHTRRWTRRVG